MMSQYSMGRLMINDNNASSATPIALSGERIKKNNRGS
jgi:hypothetical protein